MDSKKIIYLTMAGMVITGAGSGIAIKLVDSTTSLGKYFHHPYFQTVPMFLGEILGFVFVWISNWQTRKEYGSLEACPDFIQAKKNGLKTDFNPLILAIPMLCDLLASITLMVGYINIAASIAQMIGSLIVFVTAIESILFLKKVIYRHHWVGASGVVVGICLVALSALVNQNETTNGNSLLGVSMMVISAIMQGTQFAVEEKIMSVYYVTPFQFVGWEGIWGLLSLFFILPILQYIPCTSQMGHDGYVENSIFAIEQILDSYQLMVLLLCMVIIICLYNGFGMAVTKMVSSTNRVVLRQLKIVLIWLFFLIYPFEGNESFKILQLVGFSILVFGVFLYNEVIIIHKGGMAQHLLIQKDQEDHEDKSSNEYIEFENANKEISKV